MRFPLASLIVFVYYAKQTTLKGKVYLIAVLMVLEACVVVHKTIKFLKALVLLLCLQNRDKTQSQSINS